MRQAGRYPATVRFANADSNINNDSKADVRAMSFAVEPRRRHASRLLDERPAHVSHQRRARVRHDGQGGHGADDGGGRVGTAVQGQSCRLPGLPSSARDSSIRRCSRTRRRRYWSTVPFRQGPTDVIKYSLTPCVGNPAADLQPDDPNTLQDELVRHLETDTTMSCFDFGLQLLDTHGHDVLGTAAGRRVLDRERQRGMEGIAGALSHGGASHASCRRRSLPAATCEAWHIDVTEHSTSDSAPLGSINRARWRAEAASRKARLEQ